MKHFYQHNCLSAVKTIFRSLTLGLLICIQNFSATAQCPPNIDFEMGDFTGWECSIGHTLYQDPTIYWDAVVNPALYPTRFEMFSLPPGNGRDRFGNFTVNCPK